MVPWNFVYRDAPGIQGSFKIATKDVSQSFKLHCQRILELPAYLKKTCRNLKIALHISFPVHQELLHMKNQKGPRYLVTFIG